MKDYNKFMKTVGDDTDFEVIKNGNKCTIKVRHLETQQIYSVHPGDKAVKPLRAWMNKFKN